MLYWFLLHVLNKLKLLVKLSHTFDTCIYTYLHTKLYKDFTYTKKHETVKIL